MNKFFKYLAFLFVILLTFGGYSCGKEDDPQNGNIIGSWKVAKVSGIGTEGMEVVQYVQFRTDGMMLVLNGWMKDGKFTSEWEVQSYERKGNKLYINMDKKVEEVQLLKLTKSELVFVDKENKRIELVRVQDFEVNKYL